MTTFQFQTHVPDSGEITLPLEFRDRRVVVFVDKDCERLNEKSPITKKRKACTEDVPKFMDTCYGCLEELSDEKFGQLKMERILGKSR